MKNKIGRALLFAAAALMMNAAASAQNSAPRPTPTPPGDDDPVRIITEEVKMNVLAFDETGQFVEDVQPQDLVITDNDILHQPTSLRRIPANVMIVMDTGGELRTVKTLDRTREAARTLVAALKKEDSIALIQYGDTTNVVAEWTTDKDAILDAIGRTKFGKRAVFLDAFEKAVGMLRKNPSDNRHLVLITDGTDSFNGAAERAAAFRRVLGTDINVHVISYTALESQAIEPKTRTVTNTRPPQALPPEVVATLPQANQDLANAPKIGPTIITDREFLRRMRNRKEDLETAQADLIALSDNTNGLILIPESIDEMIAKAPRIARTIDASYVLTYTPKLPPSEYLGERMIEVTSRKPGLIVEARRRLVVNELPRP